MFACKEDPQQSLSPSVRCAVALNNIGCVLLEKGCQGQAYATFQDALQMVKRHVEQECDEPVQIRDDMQDKLHQAELRLIQPVVSAPEALPHRPLMYNASSPSLQVVLCHLLNDSHYALRIDVSGADDARQIPADILSTIILINFVNAGRRAARTEERTIDEDSSRQAHPGLGIDRVLRVLGLANALAENDGDSALFLVLVALDTSIQVHEEAGKVVEADALRTRLEGLKWYVETTLGFLFGQPVAAGAA
jgi:hypothetical protein